ncbi:MAG: DMT family transporter [Rhodocyclaceae bacterium]|nr:DMT family transporter [Rhodocyclaceae bacterium]
MDSRKALDGQAMAIMLVLCLIWGLQQVVLKAAAADVTPLMQIAMRTGIAAVLVGLLMARRGERIRFADGTWRPGLLVGFLFALEFLLVGEGLRFTSASHMVVFLYTAPIFVALGLHWKLPAERLAAIQWFGVALAFGGIVIAFFGREQPDKELAAMLWGDLLALGAGIAWAATTVAVRLSSLAREPATKTLFYQLAVGFVLLMLAAIALGQTGFKPTPLALGSLLFQALVVSFASYLAWFWLLRQYLASRLGVFSFLTPLFGVAFGVWLLDEPLEPSFLIGATLVCAGIILVSGYGWIRSLFGGER